MLIRPGELQMGSPAGEAGRSNDEGPVHKVRLSKPFYLGRSEVTQAAYEKVTGNNPAAHRGPDLPAENVSWEDAIEFCRKLTELELKAGTLPEGARYRLPTEAEWEYACRAGTQTRYAFGDSDWELGEYGWYDGNSGNETHAVMLKKPNAWGLFDMHGNVWEWCADWKGEYPASDQENPVGPGSGDQRVLRGGACDNDASYLRCACRMYTTHLPLAAGSALSDGFRCAW